MRPLILLFALHVGRGQAGADPWFSRDKAKHFFTSAFVQSASFSALRATGAHKGPSLIGATALSLSVGVGKELYDWRFGGDPSLKDLTWDAAGIAAASVLLKRTEP